MPARPGIDQLRRIAHSYGMHMSDADLESFRGLMGAALASYQRLDQLAEPTPPVRYPRTSGYRPGAEENPLNAWYWKCSIKGASDGPLAGKRVAIKDNVCVAGVPMMNGTAVLEGYVPEFDATIVTRILDAGGEIVGKAVCESLCFSGGSHTSDTGPVHNPHDPARSAGGSSSGSAALVVAGECDMAIGGDQGGSIRIPSCWCGAYGLKPTYGLVPYTGIFPIELTLDHTGPIAATTADVALLLEVIAGEDGLDPRQKNVKTAQYTAALANDTEGLRIGIVREGFGWPGLSEKDVDEMVEASARKFAQLGAQVSEISIPMHRDGIHIWNAIGIEGPAMLMVRGNSMGTNWQGQYNTSLLDAYARGRLTRADDLSHTVKLITLLGQYMQDSYHGRYYAKAQNLARVLRKAYDDALQSVDLLVMPTLPMKATEIPPVDASREESVARSLEMIANTCPFDVTGHPAMSVPCGLSNGLPVGMMLVGRKWEEPTVLRASHAFEQISGYTVRPQRLSAGVAQA
ncbi:MAG TPA: amidase [Ktedonobacteraceae bacterium]|jgi:amidase|nr:amidase [Ktedonobacteraceae bacterium]